MPDRLPPPLTCIIHTRDSARTIEQALASAAWAAERIVVDMDSHDGTREIARRLGAAVLDAPVALRVDGIRNAFVDKASHEWVLVLDSDESLAEDAPQQIARLLAEHGSRYDAFGLPRFNIIGSQILMATRYYPDHQIRLFRQGTVRWADSSHEVPSVVTGRLLLLQPPACPHILHRNYRDLREFVIRQASYAAQERYEADPSRFDFSAYIARAYEELALRPDTEADGDLSHAVSLLLAWDALVRGLCHWDSLAPRPPLAPLAALPVAAERVPWLRIRMRRWLWRHYPLNFLLRRVKEKAEALYPPLRRLTR